ncbi:UreD-domain-containing protein [Coniophora puteana RWD-64-598 SS2]|uniref:UreD-domain-containing protein n=1 Tax=Coniophora puteana (strain RWD-64-598) TaxID=741705 RepID=A0A5M3N698_CONPW|nr:UreD-domain-containing protein [Coniophora puteana RWD-64-598 SS2]EIW86836.1 UreD-domain-containing protein [Coniophora puteana RWD-64-598 SS2]
MPSFPPKSQQQSGGIGRIACQSHGSGVVFSELSASYPLKLLAPRLSEEENVAITYVMTYGGGLVGGDDVQLFVDVGAGVRLLLLTQGTTKVFKTRPGLRTRNSVTGPQDGGHDPQTTSQTMTVSIPDDSALLLLPDSVTCFRSASYTQIQRFHLSANGSLAVLDWINCGRKSMGEEWAFTRYYSVNEVFVEGRRVARDVLLLEDPAERKSTPESASTDSAGSTSRTLKDQLQPYSCYAMLLLCGPLTKAVVSNLSSEYQKISIFQKAGPDRLLWSLSAVDNGRSHVVRVAGTETEDVKDWLRHHLSGLENVVGTDAYRKAFT